MQLFTYQELNSTQAQARDLLEEHRAPFVVIADSQSSGKGTKGRSWHSPEGGLYLTLVLELDYNLLKKDTAALSEELCFSMVGVLRDFLQEYFPDAGLDALGIKPINDLYYKDAKLAGILLESINKYEKSILLVGIGLNIAKLEGLDLDRKYISLEEILDSRSFSLYDRERFVTGLAESLYASLRAEGEAIHNA